MKITIILLSLSLWLIFWPVSAGTFNLKGLMSKSRPEESVGYLRGPDKLDPFLRYWVSAGDDFIPNIKYKKIADWIENHENVDDHVAIKRLIKSYLDTYTYGGEPQTGLYLPNKGMKLVVRPLLIQLYGLANIQHKGSCSVENINHVLRFYVGIFGFDGFGLNTRPISLKRYKGLKDYLDKSLRLRTLICSEIYKENYLQFRTEYGSLYEPMNSPLDKLMSKTHAYHQMDDKVELRGGKPMRLIRTARMFFSLPTFSQYRKIEGVASDYNVLYDQSRKLCAKFVRDSSSSLDYIIMSMKFLPDRFVPLREEEDPSFVKVFEYARICHTTLSENEPEEKFVTQSTDIHTI